MHFLKEMAQLHLLFTLMFSCPDGTRYNLIIHLHLLVQYLLWQLFFIIWQIRISTCLLLFHLFHYLAFSMCLFGSSFHAFLESEVDYFTRIVMTSTCEFYEFRIGFLELTKARLNQTSISSAALRYQNYM